MKELTKKLKRTNNNLLKQSMRMNIIAGDSDTAFKFDPSIARLELVLLSKNVYKKLAGLKQFWQFNLPTLKFHNSDMDMVVTRIRPKKKADYDNVPCIIRVHYTSGKVDTLECAEKHHTKILTELVRKTAARRLPESEIPRITLPSELD